MATLNSFLFLFSTLAPNMEPPGNVPVTQMPIPEWVKNPVPHYGENAPPLTQMVCGATETLRCDSHCERNCSNYDQDISCPDICVLGCACIDPFIRGPDGSCIMSYECPSTLDISAVTDGTYEPDDVQCSYDEEVSSFPHCQRNCSNVEQMIICPGEGPRGCVCKSPKIRGPDGTCIMPQRCPQIVRLPQDDDDSSDITCPINEEVSCFSHCQRNCTTYNKHIPCPMYCVTGCVCSPPMIRGPDGSCIRPEQCSETLSEIPELPTLQRNVESVRALPGPFDNFKFCEGENEVYKVCSTQCPDNCKNYKNTRRACKLICLPLPKCECKEGFVRGPNGNCIEPEQCPLSEFCPENEEYKECGTACEKNCENYSTDASCTKQCVPGCFCKEPMVRGPDGRCYHKENCESELTKSRKGPFLHVPNHCLFDSIHNQSICRNFDYWNDTAFRRCLNMTMQLNSFALLLPCGADVFSGVQFVCCPKNEGFEVCEGKNEVYMAVTSQCPDTCDNYQDKNRACKYIITPSSKCKCKVGFVRGPSGDCIKPEHCPHTESSAEVCPENEVYKMCGTSCQKDCENYDEDIPCTDVCQSGCFCKEPMIRGPDGQCIYKEDCPAKLNSSTLSSERCPENEEYKECGTACPKNCENYDMNLPCEFKCESGCFCKEPMIRSPDGRCIYKEECPVRSTESRLSSEKCPANEEYKECGTACPKNCENYDMNLPCEFKCESGCFCKEPMIRSPDGRCIYKEECPAKSTESRLPRINFNRKFFPDFPKLTCKENEEFSFCAPLCPDDCTNYQEARLCKNICVPGCKCVQGYIKEKLRGKCVPIEECEEKKTNECSDLEVYNDCGSYCEKDCYNYNITDYKCEDVRCKQGCFCQKELVRSPDGKCIPPESCPAQSNPSWRMSFLKIGRGRS